MQSIQSVRLESVKIHRHHLRFRYSVDAFEFATSIYYEGICFDRLKQLYSQELLFRVVAHIALFESMKFCSLFPEAVDLSLISHALSPASLQLYIQIYQGVFKQCWYENRVSTYRQPRLIVDQQPKESPPALIGGSTDTILVACGGGKDSFVAMQILSEAGMDFASMQYSHSVYGQAEHQHQLIANVIACVNPHRQHRISIIDDFMQFPFVSQYFPDHAGLIAPETPVSVFESLPLILHHGYRYLTMAHERSANKGNLYWNEINQDVNHQWGKGVEAEQAINQFIRAHLLADFAYFSLLQPVHDARIFKKLGHYPEALTKIHSCNIQKPWCKKCPKCAYVWLGLMAVFEPQQVDAVFAVNLFDDQDLLPTFRQLLGLADQTPFECIGEVEESWLAMKRCYEKGLSGRAMQLFVQEILADTSIDWQQLEQKYLNVYEDCHLIPAEIMARVRDLF
jgi:hypothetical protein